MHLLEPYQEMNVKSKPTITLCMLQGEGPGAEAETSFEFHRQRFCYNESIHMFEKLKFPTRVCSNLYTWQHCNT